MQEYYYKGTRNGGVSTYDSNFKYKLGLNVHPSPDKSGEVVCGGGLHLAKTLAAAKRLANRATEFYKAKAGVILAEDNEKIRCAYVWIDKRLKGEEMGLELPEGLPNTTLCGIDWLKAHFFDYSQADIDALRLEMVSDKHKFSIGLGMKPKDRKELLKQTIKA